jgi:hypothetical protein
MEFLNNIIKSLEEERKKTLHDKDVQQFANEGEKPIEQLLIANTRERRRNAEEKIVEKEIEKSKKNSLKEKTTNHTENIAPRGRY